MPPLLAIMFGVLLLVTYVRPQASAPEQIEKIAVNLARLDRAEQIEEMNVPGFRLHRLTGKLKGFWSVTVSANWRIIFRFGDGKASDVDLVDHH